MNKPTENMTETLDSTEEELTSFSALKLKPEILESLGKMGFVAPTPVQARCYECAMSGVDAVIMAQTGTGKTAAFGIPTIQKLDVVQQSVQALVLVPTRELALQVSREISAIGNKIGSKCIPVYGGTSFSNQVKEFNDGAQIIVGTPGRVLDHIKRKTMNFRLLKTVVLDEADEMLSMGFEKELREIMDALPSQRQTLLFSATIPDDIRRLAGKYMDDFVTISVSGDAVGATQISHYVYLISGIGRVTDLVRILDEERPSSAIIFCNTKEETQFVSNSLCDNGYHASAISSDLSQSEREKVLDAIRKNRIQFLVATDVAARGIDISNLSHVINFSFPDSLERYIHRTGRTGRQGKHGAAISLITPHDIGNLYMLRLTYKIFPVEKTLPEEANKTLQDELSMLDFFRSSVSHIQVDEKYYRLASRVIHSADSAFLIGTLLQQLFEKGTLESKVSRPNPQVDKVSTKEQTGKSSVAARQPYTDKKTQIPSTPSSSRPNAPAAVKPNPTAKTISTNTNHTPVPVPAQVNKPAPVSAPANKSIPVSASANKPAPASAPVHKSATASVPAQRSPVPAPAAPMHTPPVARTSTAAAPSMKKTTETVAKQPSAAKASGIGAGDIASLEKSEHQIISERSSIVPDFTNTAAETDIYIDAGRKDGLKISSLMKEIVEKTGLQRTDIGKVRMLTRSTFITVPNVNCEAVYNLLSSMDIDGHKLKVEYAQES